MRQAPAEFARGTKAGTGPDRRSGPVQSQHGSSLLRQLVYHPLTAESFGTTREATVKVLGKVPMAYTNVVVLADSVTGPIGPARHPSNCWGRSP